MNASQRYYLKHLSVCRSRCRNYKKNHKDYFKKKEREYRKRHPLIYRTRTTLRQLTGSGKNALVYLGCSWKEYERYFKSLFTKGMTWELLRAGKIHIDHKKPLSWFDLENETEKRKAFHFTNTRPMWAKDNTSKKHRYIEKDCFYNKEIKRWRKIALKALDALRALNAHYNDISKSNPGFLGKLCLQDYALMNEALLKAETVLPKYAHLMKG